MRFPAKKNAGCPKAPRDFPPRKDGILYPRRVVLGLPFPSHRVCADGRTDVRTDVTVTSEPKFLGLIVYQISLAMELRWWALPAGSAITYGEQYGGCENTVLIKYSESTVVGSGGGDLKLSKLNGNTGVSSPFSYASLVYLRFHLYIFNSSVQYFLRPDQAQSLEITLQSTSPVVILNDSGDESQERGNSMLPWMKPK